MEEVEYHRDMLAGKGINRTGWDWLKPLKSDPSGYAAHLEHMRLAAAAVRNSG